MRVSTDKQYMSTQVITRAYKYALDPTTKKEQAFTSHVGAERYTYNRMLSLVKATLDQREAEKTYGIPEELLTPHLDWSHYGLRKHWNNVIKTKDAPWWRQNSKEAYSDGCSRLARGLSNFRESRNGARAGRRVGFPTYQKKHDRDSITFTTGIIRVEPDRRHITLPVIGMVKTHESTRKLARHLERGTAQVTKATLSRSGNRWYVSFTVNIVREVPETRAPQNIVGVDVGTLTLYTGADRSGEQVLKVVNPRWYRKAEKTRTKCQRNLARKRKAQTDPHKPSQRYSKEQARLRNLEADVRNGRLDHIHKTTTYLAKNYDVVVIEDLNIVGMLKYNKGLAKSIMDAGFSMFRAQLEYKCRWYGSELVFADRWFPSSKLCSDCGVVKTKLSLSERMFDCDACGLELDRDLNAARNLVKYGEVALNAGSRPVSERGGVSKTKETSVSEVSASETLTSNEEDYLAIIGKVR